MNWFSKAMLKTIVMVGVLVFSVHAQVPASKAESAWPSFWSAFKLAINAKDKAKLLKMMPDDFFDAGGGQTPAECLQYIDQNERKGSWRDLRRSISRGTRVSKRHEKLSTRFTLDHYYYFEFRNGQWWFAGVAGD